MSTRGEAHEVIRQAWPTAATRFASGPDELDDVIETLVDALDRSGILVDDAQIDGYRRHLNRLSRELVLTSDRALAAEAELALARDTVEAVGGMLEVGADGEVRRHDCASLISVIDDQIEVRYTDGRVMTVRAGLTRAPWWRRVLGR